MLEKLIKIFRANSFWHLVKIFFVFGITGSFSVYISGPILNLINLEKLIEFLPFYWIVRIVIITIAYQLSLLLIAFVFGEFKYFLAIQKKFISRFRVFRKDKESSTEQF